MHVQEKIAPHCLTNNLTFRASRNPCFADHCSVFNLPTTCTNSPSSKKQEAAIRCFKGQIRGWGNKGILGHVSRGVSARIFPKEASVESGLSLQTRRALLKPRDLPVPRGNDRQEEEQTLDATTRSNGIQSQVRDVAAQPCKRRAMHPSPSTPTPRSGQKFNTCSSWFGTPPTACVRNASCPFLLRLSKP